MQNNELDQTYHKFITTNKSLIVAPAGCGKTHAIAETVPLIEGRVLILTHTHAGIAAIKEKLKKKSVPSGKFRIETIAGYAQSYVLAFTPAASIPSRTDKTYYPFIYSRFKELLSRWHIQRTISLTYTNVIVDEYQDCIVTQHDIIIKLSDFQLVHALGDEMQGIFRFGNQELVDWEVVENNFETVGRLNEPWRWKQDGRNRDLGSQISQIRQKLENNESINLSDYSEIETRNAGSFSFGGGHFYRTIDAILKQEENLLIIDPDSSNKSNRIKIVTSFKGRIYMLEALDDKDFYNRSEIVDKMQEGDTYGLLLDLTRGILNKRGRRKNPLFTNISTLLGDSKPKKTDKNPRVQELLNRVRELVKNYSLSNLQEVLEGLNEIPGVNTPSREQYTSLLKSIRIAIEKDATVVDSAQEFRQVTRRAGRKICRHVIGTTLLTKGLEVDAVLILNVHGFKDKKNFYVAISRACKRLIIFSNGNNALAFRSL